MSTPQDPFRPPPEGDGRSPDNAQPAWGAQPGPAQPASGAPGQGEPGWGAPPAGGQPGWGQPGQPAWGSPGGRPPFGTAGGPPRNGVGTAALVVGVLSVPAAITLVGGAVLGLVAIVLGVSGRRRARQGTATNGGAATAGIVLGVLGLLATAAVIAAGVSLLTSDSGRSLVECVQDAPDQAAVEECQRSFEEEVVG